MVGERGKGSGGVPMVHVKLVPWYMTMGCKSSSRFPNNVYDVMLAPEKKRKPQQKQQEKPHKNKNRQHHRWKKTHTNG